MGFLADVFDFGGGDDELERAFQIFSQIELPDHQEEINKLNEMLATGAIRPEEYEAALADPSLLTQYTVDPRLRDAQFGALERLVEIGEEGGLTATDRARLNQIAEEEAAQERGAREAIIQGAQARGVGGSGLELASQLISGQESAGRRSRRGFDVAAEAQERALNAIMGAGELGGNIRGQQFAEQKAIAEAQDAINRFNAANITDARKFGALSRTGQQDRLLGIMDRIAEARRRRFEDELRRAGGQTGQLQAQAGLQEERRGRGAQLAGAGIGALGTALSDEDAKKNIESGAVDVDNFLDNLEVHKFEYTDPGNGTGPHFGVMAQELEQSPVGKSMVVEGNDGLKYVDYGKGQGVMLAALKNLSERLEAMENGNAR